MAALGIEYFEHILPDIIRNCSHQKAYVREGYLTIFKVFNNMGYVQLIGISSSNLTYNINLSVVFA